jgi:hypothetical protein
MVSSPLAVTPPLRNFPADVLLHILDYVAHSARSHMLGYKGDPRPYIDYKPAGRLSMTIYNFILVNRHWNDVFNEALYRRPVLVSPARLLLFARALQQQPHFGGLVAELVLVDLPNARPLSDDCFHNLMYGRNLEQCNEPLRVLTEIVSRTRSSLQTIHFESPTQIDGLPLVTEGNGLPKNISTEMFSSLRTLVLAGYASYLFRSPSAPLAIIPDLPMLEELTLHSIHFGKVYWPSLPALVALTMTWCSFSRPMSMTRYSCQDPLKCRRCERWCFNKYVHRGM